MVLPGFTGPSYTSLSSQVSNDETINLFLEVVESGLGKNRAVLYGSPGTRVFCTFPENPILGEIEVAGRLFVIAGGGLYEAFAAGNFIRHGSVNGIGPFSLATNAFQVIVVNGPDGYILDLGTNVVKPIPDFPHGTSVSFMDGYFILAGSNGRQFNISALNDGMSWDPLDIALKEGAADNLIAVLTLRRQVWLYGAATTEVWWNTGNNNFPFQPVQGALIQEGTAAIHSPAVVGNGAFWLGADSRGNGSVYNEQNYSPIRISTFAMENELGNYANIADAVGSTYQEEGHEFFMLHFPTAGVTWAFDTSNATWTKRGVWQSATSNWTTALGRYHAFAFAKHIVGGGDTSGNLYEQDLRLWDDAGTPIRRLRRCPHISSENRKIRYARVQVELDRGIGVPSDGQDADPVMMMRYSDTGGRGWSAELTARIGEVGEYRLMTLWRRLGSSRDRVFEFSTSSAIFIGLINAYVNESAGTEASG